MPFVDILGQEAVIARLLTARRRQRLAHGYLFVGADGTGREEVARALAQAVLCETPVDGDACGSCGSCRRVVSGSHPDLQLVLSEAEQVRRGLTKPEGGRNPSTEIRVDAVRELSRRLRLQAYEGRGRVGVVVSAHRLRVEAANALLKTLEEPAPGTLLVLIAPGPRAVLDTLRSRCQVVRFAPLALKVIAELVQARAAVDAEVAQVAAARADGSLARALDLCGEDVVDRARRCRGFLLAAAGAHRGDVLDLAAELGRDRARTLEHLEELQRLLHDRVRARAAARVPAELDRLGHAFATVQATMRAVRGNASPQLAFEALGLRLEPLLQPLLATLDAWREEGSP